MQNPYIDALVKGSQASNQNYQLAQQGFNSTANILNSVGSLSMKMITMLDQEEANKITQMQNQSQILNQAFHNIASEQLQKQQLAEQTRANKANEMINIQNSNEKARHDLSTEDYQNESLKNQQKNIEENNAYRNKSLALSNKTLNLNKLKNISSIFQNNINNLNNEIANNIKLAQIAYQKYNNLAGSDSKSAQIYAKQYSDYSKNIADKQNQLKNIRNQYNSFLSNNNLGTNSQSNIIPPSGSVSTNTNQPVNLQTPVNINQISTNANINQNQVSGNPLVLGTVDNMARATNSIMNNGTKGYSLGNINKNYYDYYKQATSTIGTNSTTGKNEITYFNPDGSVSARIQPFTKTGSFTTNFINRLNTIVNKTTDPKLKAIQTINTLKPIMKEANKKLIENIISDPTSINKNLSQIINNTNNLLKGIKNKKTYNYLSNLSNSKIIIDVAKTIGNLPSYSTLDDDKKAKIAKTVNKGVNNYIEKSKIKKTASNLYKDKIWKALKYNPIIARELDKAELDDSSGAFFKRFFTKETLNNNIYRASNNQSLLANLVGWGTHSYGLNQFDINGSNLGNDKATARVFKNTFMDMNTRFGLPTPFVTGTIKHLDHLFSATGMERNYEIIGSKIYKKLLSKIKTLTGNQYISSRMNISKAKRDRISAHIEELKNQIQSPSNDIMNYIKQTFVNSEPVEDKVYTIPLKDGQNIKLTGNELYNIGFNSYFKTNVVDNLDKDKQNYPSDYQ